MIANKIILWGTSYGKIKCCLSKIMGKKNLTIYQLARLTDLKYEVIERYYDNTILRYDAKVLAKLCFTLDCSISDLLEYKK